MDVLITKAIKILAGLLLGTDVFRAILGAVERWAERGISGIEKRQAVIDELEELGYLLAKSTANLGVELAVTYLKRVAK